MSQEEGTPITIERRNKTRILCSYPAVVRGDLGSGKKFEVMARVVNLSVSGIYMVIQRELQNGCALSVKIAFPTGPLVAGESNLAIKGTVVHSEPHADGSFGVGIKFQNYYFR